MLGEETDETGETGTLSRAPPRDGTFLEGFFFLLFAPQGHSTAHAAASGFVMEGGLFLLIAAGRPAGWIGSLIPACAAGDNVAVEIGSEGGRGSCCAVVASSTGTPVAFPRCVDDGVRTTLESDFGVSNLRGSSVSLFLCLSDGLRCHAAEYRTGFCCCCWTGGGQGRRRTRYLGFALVGGAGSFHRQRYPHNTVFAHSIMAIPSEFRAIGKHGSSGTGVTKREWQNGSSRPSGLTGN